MFGLGELVDIVCELMFRDHQETRLRTLSALFVVIRQKSEKKV